MSTKLKISTLTTLLAVATLTSAYSIYRDRIPNGGQVPHPCKPNYIWRGVGHVNPLGGGPKNTFGADFLRLGAQWNLNLCQLDSDGDGMTNGQELGDPNCTWTVGAVPTRLSAITHPGVCDPWENVMCQVFNSWINCDTEEFQCQALQQDTEIQNITLRFPPTAVPNTETNYMCMTFDLPDDDLYQLVATEPFIDNAQVMHHMILHGCDGVPNPSTIPTPTKCDMEAGSRCREIIGAWTVGSAGSCMPDQAGYLFGKGVYTRVILEFHWNNPELRSDYTDSSGMTLYYTRNLRPNNATTIPVGQMVLEIPPQQPSVEITGTCPSSCTSRLFAQPFYVIRAVNHMHYLGRSQKVEVFREGRLVSTVTNDEVYNYDSPAPVIHDPPIQILPGDEIKTTCVYNSQYRTETVRYGQSTSDEMCFAFLTIYPKEALPYFKGCLAVGKGSICDLDNGGVKDRSTPSANISQTTPAPTADPGVVDGCDWVEFTNTSSPDFGERLTNLYTSCDAFGECRSECQQLLAGLQGHPCLYGNAWKKVKAELVTSHHGMLTLAFITSCPLVNCPQCQQCY